MPGCVLSVATTDRYRYVCVCAVVRFVCVWYGTDRTARSRTIFPRDPRRRLIVVNLRRQLTFRHCVPFLFGLRGIFRTIAVFRLLLFAERERTILSKRQIRFVGLGRHHPRLVLGEWIVHDFPPVMDVRAREMGSILQMKWSTTTPCSRRNIYLGASCPATRTQQSMGILAGTDVLILLSSCHLPPVGAVVVTISPVGVTMCCSNNVLPAVCGSTWPTTYFVRLSVCCLLHSVGGVFVHVWDVVSSLWFASVSDLVLGSVGGLEKQCA